MSVRICACGCGGSLEERRAGARYLDVRCRVRAHRGRREATSPQTSVEAHVTLRKAPTTPDVRGGGPGAQRLLVALVKNGLGEEHLHAAAAIALVLDDGAADNCRRTAA